MAGERRPTEELAFPTGFECIPDACALGNKGAGLGEHSAAGKPHDGTRSPNRVENGKHVG